MCLMYRFGQMSTLITEVEEPLFALRTSLAGLGVYGPTMTAYLQPATCTSRQGPNVIVEAVKGDDVFHSAQHLENL